jgi:nucleotide-binding universal stress UspA family protein
MKVLVGVDGSTFSDAALEEVSQRPWPKGTEILVVHAFEPPLAATPEGWALPPNYFEELDHTLKETANSIARSAVERLSSLDNSVKVTGKALLGSPKRVILDEAEEWNPDLIVVGSHGYSVWGRLLLGSVSQAVVNHAKCSVEVVRRKQTESAAA